MAIRILLLEDDTLFNATLQDFLEEEGFVLDCVLDPYSALECTYTHNYNLYLFDVNLPYESGFDLLQKLRQSGDTTPTIFITSREDSASLYEGFMQGGDDYMKKPIDLDELRFRIDALLRRQIRTQSIEIGKYHFDSMSKTLMLGSQTIELSAKVSELLLTLLEGKGSVVTTATIKSRLWSTAEEESDGALRVYITQLKKYFPTQIENIRGVGYKMSLSC